MVKNTLGCANATNNVKAHANIAGDEETQTATIKCIGALNQGNNPNVNK
jgi:hypothetical protein